MCNIFNKPKSTDPLNSTLFMKKMNDPKIDNIHPCDTTLLPHHQPVTELCMS